MSSLQRTWRRADARSLQPRYQRLPQTVSAPAPETAQTPVAAPRMPTVDTRVNTLTFFAGRRVEQAKQPRTVEQRPVTVFQSHKAHQANVFTRKLSDYFSTPQVVDIPLPADTTARVWDNIERALASDSDDADEAQKAA